jgi:methionine-S-sulfoxide reductase
MKFEEALFAMGCFWCAEHAFSSLKGVTLKCGYAGGEKPFPTYQSHEGYREALLVTFDPEKISYKELLSLFWRNIDPFDEGGQLYDRGFSYTTAIYYQSEEQKKEAELFKRGVETHFKRVFSLPILPRTTFYEAEASHQEYALKNPLHYEAYRCGSGRDRRLKEIWQSFEREIY